MTAALYKADIAIFVIFLALIVITGFKYRARGITFREYAVGDKRLDDPILTTTIIATWISGSWLLIDLEETYSRGLVYIIASVVGSTAVLLITGRILGPRMGKFMHSVSASHALGALYGRPVQVTAGVVLVATSIGYAVLQFVAISRMLEVLLGYGGPEPMLIVGTTVILYAAAGGIKAVTFTDALQLLTFGVLLPALSLGIRDHMEHAGLVRQLIDTDPRFSLSEIFRSPPDLMQAIVLMLYFGFPGLAPQLFQRMVMAQDTRQIKRTMTYAALVCLAVQACIAWIAVLLLADHPGLAPNQLLTYIAERHTHTGLRGLLGVGVLALAMSTADSVLNAGAVIFANDVVAPLQSRPEGTRSVAKWATLGIGLVALSLAPHVQHLLTIVLTSASLYMPIVTIPMLLAIFGFQTSQRTVLIGMGAGLATTSASLYYTQSPYSLFPGMLANLVVTLSAHRWQHYTSGWGHNSIPEDLLLKRWVQRWRQKLTELRQLEPHTYLQSNVPKHTAQFVVFGSYAFLVTGASLLDLSAGARQHYFHLYQLIYSSAFLVTTSFILHPIWPDKLKNHPLLAYVWPSVIFFALFGLSGMLTIMSGFKRLYGLSFVANTAFAMLMMHWPIAILMSATGAVLTAQLFKWNMGVTTLPGELDTYSLTAFIFTIATLPAWAFMIRTKDKTIAWLQGTVRHKDKKQGRLVENALKALETEKSFAQSVTNEGVHTANAVAEMCQKMLQEPANIKPDDVKDAGQRARYIANYLSEALSRAQGYLQLKATQMKLPSFVQKVQDGLEEWYFGAKDRVKFQVDTQQKVIQGDIDKLCHLLWSALCHTCEHAPEERNFIVRVQDTKLDYLLNPATERVKKVKALCFTITAEDVHWDAKDLYRGCTEQTTIPPQLPPETELLITNHQSVVDAHYGALEWTITEQGPAHAYVIPVRVREVRPQTMENLTARRVPNNVISAQEREFIRTVEEKTNLDPSLLHKALRIIKTYQAGAAKQPGPPPYLRSMAVAQLLLEYNTTDPDVILSTLIKDTVEQTRFSFHQVAIMFNDTVRHLTEKLMNFGDLMNTSKRIQLSDFERTYQLLTETEHRILYIEVMNCLYNMRNIEQYASVEEQRQVALHNLRFGVPMARALGLKKVEQEFRKASTTVLNAAMTFDYSD